eukprot:7378797-Prymnesium_polylepis.1
MSDAPYGLRRAAGFNRRAAAVEVDLLEASVARPRRAARRAQAAWHRRRRAGARAGARCFRAAASGPSPAQQRSCWVSLRASAVMRVECAEGLTSSEESKSAAFSISVHRITSSLSRRSRYRRWRLV